MQDTTTTKDQDLIKTRRARPIHIAGGRSVESSNANADALREVHMSLVRAEQNLYNLVQASHAANGTQFSGTQFSPSTFGVTGPQGQAYPTAAFAQGFAPAAAIATPTGLAFGAQPSFTAWGTSPAYAPFGTPIGTPFGNAPQALLAPWKALAASIASTLGVLAQTPGLALGSPTPAYPVNVSRALACDISDEGKSFVCSIDLPGVQADQIELLSFDRVIVVNAYREHDGDVATLVQAERSTVTQQRTIMLPADIQPSGVKATLADGILTLVAPKLNPTEGPRRIKVQG